MFASSTLSVSSFKDFIIWIGTVPWRVLYRWYKLQHNTILWLTGNNEDLKSEDKLKLNKSSTCWAHPAIPSLNIYVALLEQCRSSPRGPIFLITAPHKSRLRSLCVFLMAAWRNTTIMFRCIIKCRMSLSSYGPADPRKSSEAPSRFVLASLISRLRIALCFGGPLFAWWLPEVYSKNKGWEKRSCLWEGKTC